MQVYRARNPKKSPLWQCAHRHYDEFEAAYPLTLLWLVQQQDARGPPARRAAGVGPPPSGPFATTATATALQEVARCHPTRLACGPPALPMLHHRLPMALVICRLQLKSSTRRIRWWVSV